jgi:hypothetical protein
MYVMIDFLFLWLFFFLLPSSLPNMTLCILFCSMEHWGDDWIFSDNDKNDEVF